MVVAARARLQGARIELTVGLVAGSACGPEKGAPPTGLGLLFFFLPALVIQNFQ